MRDISSDRSRQLKKLKKLEERQIPEAIDYKAVQAFQKEILCKLEEVRPVNLGQAGRIQGMTPAALSLIMIATEKIRRTKTGKASPVQYDHEL